MKIRNLWATAREIAETGDVVEPGKTVDVDKALAERLLEQPDVWGKPSTKKSTEDSEES